MYFFNQNFVTDLWEFMLQNKHIPVLNEGAPEGNDDDDTPESVRKYRALIADLSDQNSEIIAAHDTSGENLSEEDIEKIEKNNETIVYYNKQIKLRLKVYNQQNTLNEPAGRLSDPDDEGDQLNEPSPLPSPVIRPRNRNATAKPARRAARPVDPKDAQTRGYRNTGEFAMAVYRTMEHGVQDNRLLNIGNEGQGADGGFLVPPDFRTRILELMFDESPMNLLSYVNNFPLSGNNLTMPSDDTTPWGSDGVSVSWTGEGAQIADSNPVLGQINLKLDKLAALVKVTDELVEDTVALSSYIERQTGRKFAFKVGDAIIAGTGSGQPLGFTNSSAYVTQGKATGQTRNTKPIVPENISKMWARMPADGHPRAIWLVNPEVLGVLPVMNIDGKDGGAGNIPTLMPAGGQSGTPYSMLMGRPVVPHQACATMGTKGDINFVDLSQYIFASKSGGLSQQTSIHLFFDRGQTAFRFTMRLDGQPWQTKTIAAKNGTYQQSYFVGLGA